MRVLMITSTYPRYKGDTIPAFVHELAKSMVKQGIEVHVAAPHHALSVNEEVLDGVNVHRFRYMIPAKAESLTGGVGMPPKLQESLTAKMMLIPYLLCSFLKSLDICRKYKIDVIHAHWYFPSGLIGVLLKKLVHRRLVLTGYGVEFFLASKKFRQLSFLLRWIAANSDQRTFISRAVRQAAQQVGVKGSSVIIPYGVDEERFVRLPANHEMIRTLREKHHVEKCEVILTLGRLVARKGINYLIESMPLILKEAPNAVLLIGGDGPEKENLEKLARELRLENNIRFLGNVSQRELPFLYNLCDLFVLPSITDASGDQEGFGIVLCEAMACEKPVVGSRLGGILDIIDHGKDGFLVEQKSIQELSKATLDILGNQKLSEQLGSRGRVSVEKNFSFGLLAKKYIFLYRALLKQEKNRKLSRETGRQRNVGSEA